MNAPETTKKRREGGSSEKIEESRCDRYARALGQTHSEQYARAREADKPALGQDINSH